MDGLAYTFTDVIKRWQGSKSTWYYVSLPATISDEVHTLRQYHQTRRRGWGAVRVKVTAKNTAQAAVEEHHPQWETSIFPAFDDKRFALFLKADIRKQLQVVVGSEITVMLNILF
ncbi:MAG: DUF1905 domain-containing protein [Methylophilus sp.]|uniref:DUF1905 domain-containing protein n=1 Tax=Methylophilus sp. TaxID=29541 RepID=UPI002BBFC846|nr:DUF1905 domain-containing protein [Methylophilus sp.]HSH85992.1 DUF1905 domain-containing protein [Methylophilus sp.]